MWFVPLALAGPLHPQPLPDAVQTVAVGSCAYSRSLAHPAWGAVRRRDPDLVVLLGDLVYADTEDAERLGRALRRLGRRPRFRRLTRSVPLLHVWDDHDFGPNDSDGRHGHKEDVRQVTLDFFGAAADDPRRRQVGGLYGAWTMGPPGQRVQVILLDTRWDLSPRAERTDGGVGRYAPGDGQVLGPEQWTWLAEALAEPADVRIVGSSIPFAAEYTGWETWSNFPAEQARLTTLLHDAGPVLVVSGDVHYGELSRYEGIYDATSSGLATRPYPALPNRNRIGGTTSGDHFMELELDWGRRALGVRWFDPQGRPIEAHELSFDALDAPTTESR